MKKKGSVPIVKQDLWITLGDYAVACHEPGNTILRHERLRDNFFACRAANLTPVREQKNLMPETNSRPGDLYLPCWSAGQPAALDITITSPLQPSNISNAARKYGFALRAAEDRNFEQYFQQCANIGFQFFPWLLNHLEYPLNWSERH